MLSILWEETQIKNGKKESLLKINQFVRMEKLLIQMEKCTSKQL